MKNITYSILILFFGIGQMNFCLSQTECKTDWESFPGCEFACLGFDGLNQLFVQNLSNCSGNRFSKWLNVKATENRIRVSASRFECDANEQISIQIFDDQQVAINGCTNFNLSNYSTIESLVENLEIGNHYSILIESPMSLGCDFRLEFEGIEVGRLAPISKIIFGSTERAVIDKANVSAIKGANSYYWEIPDSNFSIISGQGTQSIIFENPNNELFEICVTPISKCNLGFKKCEIINFRIEDLPPIPCCSSPNIPEGCQDAGANIEDACIVCNLAGVYSGNLNDYGPGMQFSCGEPDNSAYVTALASVWGTIEATLIYNNCTIGDGIELVLRDQSGTELDCFSETSFAAPNVGVSGLIPGELYIFQIDGINGDICDFSLIITGDPEPSFDRLNLSMTPDTTLCVGAEVCFEIDKIFNDQLVEWEIPSNLRIINGGTENDLFVCCVVDSIGGGAVQVKPIGYCFTGFSTILPILALPIYPTVWPPIFRCQTDLPWDTTIRNQKYTFENFGSQEIVFITELGCDSSVIFDLIPYIDQSDLVINCFPNENEITFEWQPISKAINYTAIINGTDSVTVLEPFINVENLNLGEEVSITVVANYPSGCSLPVLTETCITQNCPPVNLEISTNSNVPSIICDGDSDAYQLIASTDLLNPLGTFEWLGRGVTPNGVLNADSLYTGYFPIQLIYSESGCRYKASDTIRIARAPRLSGLVVNPIFKFGAVGSIFIGSSRWAKPFLLTDEDGNEVELFDNFQPGEHCFDLIDANGCEDSNCFNVLEGVYYLAPIHIICPGDKQPLTISPGTGATFSWSPSFRLSCDDCSNPIANSNRTTVYTVTATLLNGQSASQNVVVIVLPEIICNGLPQNDNNDFSKLLSDIDFQKIEEKDLVEIEKRISDFYFEKEIKIAPNPTSGIVNISSVSKLESVDVYDYSGKELMTTFENKVDLSDLAKGVYFFKIKIENRVVVKRVVLF